MQFYLDVFHPINKKVLLIATVDPDQNGKINATRNIVFDYTIDSIDYVHGIGNRRRFAHVQYERTLSSVVW